MTVPRRGNLFFILMALSKVIQVDGGCCPDAVSGTIFNYETGRCFKISTEKTDWFSAKDKCEELGGRLAIVFNTSDLDFVKDNGLGTRAAWIGINDIAEEGVYKDMEDKVVTNFQWKYNQPNDDTDPDDQDCIYLTLSKWSDKSCMENHRYICDWPFDTDHGNLQPHFVRSNKTTLCDYQVLASLDVRDKIECSVHCSQDLSCLFVAVNQSHVTSNCILYRHSIGSTEIIPSEFHLYTFSDIRVQKS